MITLIIVFQYNLLFNKKIDEVSVMIASSKFINFKIICANPKSTDGTIIAINLG